MPPPFIFQLGNRRDTVVGDVHDCTPDLRFLHEFNHVGGRPEERHGTKGSFTPGVRIVSGGQSRNVPLETKINRGTVLFESATLKPDMSAEACTNEVGGRPTERLGFQGSFTPGGRRWLGGSPRDVPLEAEINHGKVLFVSKTLRPDLSGEARTNQVRPTERLGSRGRFTTGVRIMSGGPPRDVPLETECNPGKVLFVSSTLIPDMSGEARTNVIGGRPMERLGSRGSFTPGAKKRWLGGDAREVPLEAEIDHGKVLFSFSTLKPDMSDEACTNVIGGRPTERLGAHGRFNPGATRRWLGGHPRDFPVKREVSHSTATFPLSEVARKQPDLLLFGVSATSDDDEDYGGFVETEFVEGCQQYDSTQTEDMAAFENSSSGAAMVKENSGVFRRCGSDSKFSAGADLMSEDHAGHRYPAF